MPYLNLDLDFPEHPKTKRLRARCGKDAHWNLVELWRFAGRYHPETGDLSDYTPEEIESFSAWDGDKQCLYSALALLGFIDEKDGRKLLHDWLDHQGHLAAFKIRAKKGAEKRWGKLRRGAQRKHRKLQLNKELSSNATSNTELSPSNPLYYTIPTILTIPTVPTELTKDIVVASARPSDHQAVIDFWHTAYFEKFGIKYGFDGGKDGKTIKTILSQFGQENLKTMMVAFLASTDDFVVHKGGFTLGVLKSQANKIVQQIVTSQDGGNRTMTDTEKHNFEVMKRWLAKGKDLEVVNG